MKVSEVLIILGVGIVLGLLFAALLGETRTVLKYKNEAIQRGYAEYNSTNGTWQWKEQAK